MKKQPEHVIDLVFSLSLLCVFTVCGLLVVFMGIRVYQNTVLQMDTAFSQRTAMAYVTKKIRQNDQIGGVQVGEIEGEVALVLCDTVEEQPYCTYIYYADGYLQELYAKADYTPTCTAGQRLIAIEHFAVAQDTDDTITVSLAAQDDASSVTLMLHSAA